MGMDFDYKIFRTDILLVLINCTRYVVYLQECFAIQFRVILCNLKGIGIRTWVERQNMGSREITQQ